MSMSPLDVASLSVVASLTLMMGARRRALLIRAGEEGALAWVELSQSRLEGTLCCHESHECCHESHESHPLP